MKIGANSIRMMKQYYQENSFSYKISGSYGTQSLYFIISYFNNTVYREMLWATLDVLLIIAFLASIGIYSILLIKYMKFLILFSTKLVTIQYFSISTYFVLVLRHFCPCGRNRNGLSKKSFSKYNQFSFQFQTIVFV